MGTDRRVAAVEVWKKPSGLTYFAVQGVGHDPPKPEEMRGIFETTIKHLADLTGQTHFLFYGRDGELRGHTTNVEDMFRLLLTIQLTGLSRMKVVEIQPGFKTIERTGYQWAEHYTTDEIHERLHILPFYQRFSRKRRLEAQSKVLESLED